MGGGWDGRRVGVSDGWVTFKGHSKCIEVWMNVIMYDDAGMQDKAINTAPPIFSSTLPSSSLQSSFSHPSIHQSNRPTGQQTTKQPRLTMHFRPHQMRPMNIPEHHP